MRFAFGRAAARMASKAKGCFRAAEEDVLGRRLGRLIERRKTEVETERLKRLSVVVAEQRAAPLYEASVYGSVQVRATEDVLL